MRASPNAIFPAAALGIYGVLAYDVSQRTREISVRSAIGASRDQIVSLILKQDLGKSALGVTLGLVGAFFLSRSMTSLLIGVRQPIRSSAPSSHSRSSRWPCSRAISRRDARRRSVS